MEKKRMRISSKALAAGIATALMLPLVAQAADLRRAPPAEARLIGPADTLPACETPAVLGNIQNRFASREQRFWDSPLRIVGYEDVRHVAHRPWGAAYIPRRFCAATALVDNGTEVRRHRVNYVIAEELGFAGYGYGVQWCVTGVERHLHAAPNCRMMMP
jgi:hypothetical protein